MSKNIYKDLSFKYRKITYEFLDFLPNGYLLIHGDIRIRVKVGVPLKSQSWNVGSVRFIKFNGNLSLITRKRGEFKWNFKII